MPLHELFRGLILYNPALAGRGARCRRVEGLGSGSRLGLLGCCRRVEAGRCRQRVEGRAAAPLGLLGRAVWAGLLLPICRPSGLLLGAAGAAAAHLPPGRGAGALFGDAPEGRNRF
jgi:hypothetical protein